MRQHTRHSLLIGSCLCLNLGVSAEMTPSLLSVIAITSDQFPLRGMEAPFYQPLAIQVLNLDAVSKVEQRLSEGLPADPEQAKIVLASRVDQSQINDEIREAYQALSVSMRYRLNRYPAIIVNHQAVVYGVTDINAAIAMYRDWEKSYEAHGHD